jgi:hypothetical protein
MLGAPLGGTMVGGHHCLEFSASSLITPPNSGAGAGNCLPGMVVLALGEPRVPVTCMGVVPCCAAAVPIAKTVIATAAASCLLLFICLFSWPKFDRSAGNVAKLLLRVLGNRFGYWAANFFTIAVFVAKYFKISILK